MPLFSEASLAEPSKLYRQQAPVCVLMKSLNSAMGDDDWLDWDAQEAVLEFILRSKPALKFPPPARYTVSLLRAYTEKVQSASVEDMSDGLFDLLARLQSRAHETHGFLSFDLSPLASPSLQPPGADLSHLAATLALKVEPQHNEVGLRMWEAGYLLTEYCLARPQSVAGRAVVELGAGLGLTGMAAAACCEASRMVLTDCAVGVLENMEEGLPRNGLRLHGGNGGSAETSSSSSRMTGLGDRGDGGGNSGGRCAVEVLDLDWMAGGEAAVRSLRQGPRSGEVGSGGGDTGAVAAAAVGATATAAAATSESDSSSPNATSDATAQQVKEEQVKEEEEEEEEDGFVVLAADVLYDPCIVPHFVNVVEALVNEGRKGGTEERELGSTSATKKRKKKREPVALVAATLRNPKTLQLFLNEVDRHEIPIFESSFRWPDKPGGGAGGAGPLLSRPFHFDPTAVRLFALGAIPDDGSEGDWRPM